MADGLADLPADALRRAAAKARDTLRFFPTVADLRALAGQGGVGVDDAATAEAMAAWEHARAWCVRHRDRLRNIRTGQYGNEDQGGIILPAPPPISPLAPRVFHALLACGGVNRVMSFRDDPEGTKWCRRDFIEAYKLAPAVEEASLQLASGEALQIVAGLAQKLALKEATNAN
jgi:hypothetical protein